MPHSLVPGISTAALCARQACKSRQQKARCSFYVLLVFSLSLRRVCCLLIFGYFPRPLLPSRLSARAATAVVTLPWKIQSGKPGTQHAPPTKSLSMTNPVAPGQPANDGSEKNIALSAVHSAILAPARLAPMTPPPRKRRLVMVKTGCPDLSILEVGGRGCPRDS